MSFSLLQLEEAQLREIAESRVPVGLSQRTDQGALPPGFVAARALSLLSKGNGEFWSSTCLIVRNRDDRIVGACGFKHAPKAGLVEVGSRFDEYDEYVAQWVVRRDARPLA